MIVEMKITWSWWIISKWLMKKENHSELLLLICLKINFGSI